MELAKALGVKYIIATIITFSIYGMFGQATLGNLFLISVLVIILPYLGDLFVLPRIGNLLATASDFGLYFLLYLGLASMFIGMSPPIVLTSFAAAFFTAISESILHIYILENIFDIDQKNPTPIPIQQLQTEFAEETDAQSIRKDDHLK